jgi:hypothetical protein
LHRYTEVTGDWQGVLGFCLRKGYSKRAVVGAPYKPNAVDP